MYFWIIFYSHISDIIKGSDLNYSYLELLVFENFTFNSSNVKKIKF
jgi:hypothetical protein